MKHVMFFPNGTTAVFVDAQQQADLQSPWLILFAEFLESQGQDPTAFVYTMPDRSSVRLFRTAEGKLNWKTSQ